MLQTNSFDDTIQTPQVCNAMMIGKWRMPQENRNYKKNTITQLEWNTIDSITNSENVILDTILLLKSIISGGICSSETGYTLVNDFSGFLLNAYQYLNSRMKTGIELKDH